MTGYDLYKRVCALMGYTDLAQNGDNIKSTAFCSIINQVAEDLGLSEVKGMADPLCIPNRYKEAFVYGCAMFFAISLNDSGCANIFTNLYNLKRSRALCTKDARSDVLPNPQCGGM